MLLVFTLLFHRHRFHLGRWGAWAVCICRNSPNILFRHIIFHALFSFWKVEVCHKPKTAPKTVFKKNSWRWPAEQIAFTDVTHILTVTEIQHNILRGIIHISSLRSCPLLTMVYHPSVTPNVQITTARYFFFCASSFRPSACYAEATDNLGS